MTLKRGWQCGMGIRQSATLPWAMWGAGRSWPLLADEIPMVLWSRLWWALLGTAPPPWRCFTARYLALRGTRSVPTPGTRTAPRIRAPSFPGSPAPHTVHSTGSTNDSKVRVKVIHSDPWPGRRPTAEPPWRTPREIPQGACWGYWVQVGWI